MGSQIQMIEATKTTEHNIDTWEWLVRNERDRQILKWGDKARSLERLYVILGEEVGELAAAIIERANVDGEIVQVAAVCRLIWDTGRKFGYCTEKGNIETKRKDIGI